MRIGVWSDAPAGARHPTRASKTPGYLSASARVGYQISAGFVVAVSGQNLANPRQIHGAVAGLEAPRRVIVSLTKSWRQGAGAYQISG